MDYFLKNALSRCQHSFTLVPRCRILRIGRGPFNDLCISEHWISRLHCEIWREDDDSLWLRDLGSRNSTYINNHRVLGDRPVLLDWGDQLRLGGTVLEVTLQEIPWHALHHDLVRRVAAGIEEGNEWEAMPVLADALIDVGCPECPALEHCRSFSSHQPGCWVLELILECRI